jgi:hypothetical protein
MCRNHGLRGGDTLLQAVLAVRRYKKLLKYTHTTYALMLNSHQRIRDVYRFDLCLHSAIAMPPKEFIAERFAKCLTHVWIN